MLNLVVRVVTTGL